MADERRPPITDDMFMTNVREARDAGFDFCCSDCGCGILDDSDLHDMWCPQNPKVEDNFALAERWAAKQQEGKNDA